MKIGKRGWHKNTLFHDEEWAKVLRRDPCVYCGSLKEGTVEHIDPFGPRSPVINGAGACRSCNGERGSAPLIVYLLWRSTDRAESFNRWNFRLHSDVIRERQLERKRKRFVIEPEAVANPLRVSIGERVGMAGANP